MYHLTRSRLLEDLHTAYHDARRHKNSKGYVLHFERNRERYLQVLCDELWTRTYKARPSTCFIITDPKRREVFAADFRDRIVHHLYYNYTHRLFERTFIQDSYSCIPDRGTHYGVERLRQHIQQESRNYSRPCYVLKMDIRGYFMHINRERLLTIALQSLHKMAGHRILKRVPTTWQDTIDMEFVDYLTRHIVLLDPTECCLIVGDEDEWNDLPTDKSLFHSPTGCGLPIGNLTSQLYSNVYLNELDQYMKRSLQCRHYGRYVDDFYVVNTDKERLLTLIEPVRNFLADRLSLTLHEGKIQLLPVQYGIEFLGYRLSPWRMTVSRHCLRRMERKKDELFSQLCAGQIPLMRVATALASFRGVLSHGRNYHIMKRFEL